MIIAAIFEFVGAVALGGAVSGTVSSTQHTARDRDVEDALEPGCSSAECVDQKKIWRQHMDCLDKSRSSHLLSAPCLCFLNMQIRGSIAKPEYFYDYPMVSGAR